MLARVAYLHHEVGPFRRRRPQGIIIRRRRLHIFSPLSSVWSCEEVELNEDAKALAICQ